MAAPQEPLSVVSPPHHNNAKRVFESMLGVRSFVAEILQAAMTLFVGAAGKTLNRIFLAMIGTLIWGSTNSGIGLASTFHQVRLKLSNAALYVVTTPM